MTNVVAFPRPRVVGIRSLTARNLKALRFIEAHLRQHGSWPTFDEIGEAAGGKSKRGSVRIVNQLFEANAIARPNPSKEQ